jgi:superfamily II DNA or RNA helicase
MQIELRPYQQKAVQDCRAILASGKNRLILCAPTGAGKTVIFSYIVANALAKGKRVMIVTDRTELLTQAGGALTAYGINPERIEAGADPHLMKPCYTAMVETLNRRMGKLEYLNLLESLDLIIFDEAHKQAFNKLFPYIPKKCTVIGATATPHREGNQVSLHEFYDDIVNVASIPELIQSGYLAQPLSYGVKVDLSNVGIKAGDYDLGAMGAEYSKQKVFKGVIENYKRLTYGKKAIVFSSTIAGSKELCQEMQDAGLSALHLDSEMQESERGQILRWFKYTPDAIICNVGILTTGFDEPSIEVVILYRATKSLPLFLQMCGRGSRVTHSKKTFTILDFGNNIEKHDFWEAHRTWSLQKKKKREGVAPVKECKSCGALVRASARSCDYCGAEFPRTESEKEQDAIAELKLLTKREVMDLAIVANMRDKAAMCKAKLIKPAWVLHNLKTKAEAQEFTRQMGYKPGWWFHNADRFKHLI